jgi:hypothetical protein
MAKLRFNSIIYFLNYKLGILVCNLKIKYLLIGFVLQQLTINLNIINFLYKYNVLLSLLIF